MMHDYEHSIKTGFIEPDWTIMPDLIPDHAMTDETERILKYPGLKEDVYVLGFKPDHKIAGTGNRAGGSADYAQAAGHRSALSQPGSRGVVRGHAALAGK